MTNPAPLKILAVDDEPLLLYALERAGRGRSLDITTAVTSEQALEKIVGCDFDLFLMDLDLNDENRLNLFKEIGARCPCVPIIVMTTIDKGSIELGDIIKTMRRQEAWHILEKPFSLDLLIRYIDDIFMHNINVDVSLRPQSDKVGSEKRNHQRRSHAEPVGFSYNTRIDNMPRQIFSKGILTDISESGTGVLSHEPLPLGETLTLEYNSSKKLGMVAWITILDPKTYRIGVQFC